MPKFLDRPQWYNRIGTPGCGRQVFYTSQVFNPTASLPWSLDTSKIEDQYGDGSLPDSGDIIITPNGTILTASVSSNGSSYTCGPASRPIIQMVNGNYNAAPTSSNYRIYAPTSSGNMDGQTLVSRSGSAPVWETRGIFGLRLYDSVEVPGVITWFPFDPNIRSGSSFVSFMNSMGCTSISNFYPAIGRAYEPGQNPAGGDVYGVYVSGSTVTLVGVKGDLSTLSKSFQTVWSGNSETLTYSSIGEVISQ